MPTPTFSQWRTLAQPMPFAPSSIRERQLQTLSSFVTGMNPDGSNQGSPINLLTAAESSFEDGSVPWSVAGGTLANSTAFAQSGTHSLLFTASSTGNPSMWVSRFVPLAPNYLYTASGFVLRGATSVSGTIGIQINYYSPGPVSIGSTAVTQVTDNTSTWTSMTVSGIAPPTAVSSRITVTFYSPTIGDTHYIDNVFLGIV